MKIAQGCCALKCRRIFRRGRRAPVISTVR